MNEKSHHRSIRFIGELGGREYLSIFDDFSDGVIATNAEGLIIYYNRAMSAIDELDRPHVLSRKVTEVYELDDVTSIIMQCITAKKPILNKPIYYRTRMGKFANTIHNVMPIFKEKELIGTICFVRDYHSMLGLLSSIPMPVTKEVYDTSSMTFDRIVGREPEFVRAVNSARMASSTPSPVMLYGDTGTGKELFARAIHNHGSRSSERFTPINCSAIPENLLEGILFGTSRGAFTGSVDKAGLLERTDRGTVFLDELNSMPVGLQAKILRCVQEKKVRRVGALKEIDIDLKIISSVNKDPHADISAGTLRSDLFYRLGVVFIHIVPLRERMNDLKLLVDYFILKHNVILSKAVKRISQDVMEMFNAYHWPGNVRELEHVIEGAMNVVGTHDVVRPEHLQAHFHKLKVTSPPAIFHHSGCGDALDAHSDLSSYKAVTEANAILQTLREHSGNITRTAAALGISRQLLYYKIKKFEIDRTQF